MVSDKIYKQTVLLRKPFAAVCLTIAFLPLFVLSSKLFPNQFERIVIRYREIFVLNFTSFVLPVGIYFMNGELRKHTLARMQSLFEFWPSE